MFPKHVFCEVDCIVYVLFKIGTAHMLFIEYYSINCVFNDLRNITGTAHEIAIVRSGTNS